MKIKRILALIMIVVLIAMYISTIVFALSDSPNADTLFKASIFCTVVIPVLLYGYGVIYKYVIKKEDRDPDKK
jgi:Ca2+/H+ antiporter